MIRIVARFFMMNVVDGIVALNGSRNLLRVDGLEAEQKDKPTRSSSTLISSMFNISWRDASIY